MASAAHHCGVTRSLFRLVVTWPEVLGVLLGACVGTAERPPDAQRIDLIEERVLGFGRWGLRRRLWRGAGL